MAEITLGQRRAPSLIWSQWEQAQPLLFVLPQGDTRWQQLKWQQKLQTLLAQKALQQPDGQKCGQYLTVTSSVPTYLPTAAKVVTVLRQIMRYRHENEVCALTVLLINLIDLKVSLLIAGELGLLSFKGPFLTKLYCDSMILWFFSLRWLAHIWWAHFMSEAS